MMTGDINVSEEITNCFTGANKLCFRLKVILNPSSCPGRQNFLSINTCQAISCVAESSTVTKNIERRLNVFERNIVSRISVAKCEKGQWRKRYNRELEDLYNEPNIVNVAKYSRLRWTGHVAEMDENELPKKYIYISCTNPGGQRGHGRLTGWKKTQGSWAVDIGWRLPRIEVTGQYNMF